MQRVRRESTTVGACEQPKAFVPDEFEVPRELINSRFRLEPLGPEHNAGDYEAWTSSIEHIRTTPGFPMGRWPDPEMTLEENAADLRRHAQDCAMRSGFTYTVLDTGSDRVIGCLYIYPSRDRSGVTVVRSWVRADSCDVEPVLHAAVSAWLRTDWPFASVDYPSR